MVSHLPTVFYQAPDEKWFPLQTRYTGLHCLPLSAHSRPTQCAELPCFRVPLSYA